MSFDPTKPVCTRDGRKATILSTIHTSLKDTGGYSYPIKVEVTHPNDPHQTVKWSYMADGRWKSNELNNHNDLINEQPWHVWMRETDTTVKQ